MICMDLMSKTLHAIFFPLISALRLLDLSNSSVLHELPNEIGQLINLEYFNLSDTAIPDLPSALQKLTKMRRLILNYTNKLQEIPMAMISNFPFLEVFSKLDALPALHSHGYVQYLLKELVCLRHIWEICIAIHEATSLQILLGSQKLLGCIRKLTLDDFSDMISIELPPSSVRKMEDLELHHCEELREFRITLGTGHIGNLSKVVAKITSWQYFIIKTILFSKLAVIFLQIVYSRIKTQFQQ